MQGEEDSEREERTFRMWLTSLGLDLQAISRISPHISSHLPVSPLHLPISPHITSLGLGLQIGKLVSLYLPISPYADRQPGERLSHGHPAAARRGPSPAGRRTVEAGGA